MKSLWIAFKNFFSDVSISVVVVRKADGKAMQPFKDAKAEPWESFDGDEGVVEIHGCPFDDGLQDPDEDSPFQFSKPTFNNFGPQIWRQKSSKIVGSNIL